MEDGSNISLPLRQPTLYAVLIGYRKHFRDFDDVLYSMAETYRNSSKLSSVRAREAIPTPPFFL